MSDLIYDAKQWATGLWRNSAQSWKERKQDLNYRNLVARPALKKMLKSFNAVYNGIFFDIGCGDGLETVYMRDALVECGNTGKMYGFDPQSYFIKLAMKNENDNPVFPVHFDNGLLADFIEKYGLTRNVDMITSIFVLQDMPDIRDFFGNVDRCLNAGGAGLFLLVHPEFSEAMLRKGALKINEKLTPADVAVPWRFAAEDLIVEEGGRSFFVPYFHRTIGDYKNLLKKYFKDVKFIGLKPTTENVKISEENKISPFYNHEGNVYYPEIVEMDSSLIIFARK